MNSIIQLINIARNGGSPVSMMKQMAKNDPEMAQAINIIDGKSPEQLQEIATNMAKERGTTVEEVARQIGIL